MITIENKDNIIYLFSRDKEGKAQVEVVKDFKPYFYVEDLGIFKSVNGKSLTKIYCKSPSQVPIERVKYSNTYEADIVYTNRYIIDRIEKLEKEPLRICYLDIEIARTKSGYENCSMANNPILSISVYDSFNKEYGIFCQNDNTCKTEKDVIEMFIQYIQLTNPDILVAWNGDGFDFPFLINRINKLKLNSNRLARESGSAYTTKYGAKIFGRVLFDLMYAYKKVTSNEGRESWSLEYISKYELKDKGGKEQYKGELDDLFKNDIEKFKKYNIRDVELLVLMNEKLGLIEFFDEVRRLCFCKFEDVFMNSKIADCLCLKMAKDKFVLPSVKKNEDRESYMGGFVKDAIPKLYDNIAVMDMKSLYPSIMIGFNISYETLLDKNNGDCINVNDKYYFKKEIGLIPSIVKPLLEKRKEIAKEMKIALEKYGKDSREYKTLWMNQYALKVIANSFYGVLGFKNFRLYKKEVAGSITYIAQMIIKYIHKWFEEKGVNVVYGDTDSCFLEMGERSIEDMSKLNNELNIHFKEWFKQFGISEENNIFKLEFEKVYRTMFFKSKSDGKASKKRYAGRIIWNDGKDVDYLNIVGFESRRSDSPQIGRDFLKEVLRKIVYKEKYEDIYKYVIDFKNDIKMGKYNAEEVGIPISITKPLIKYANQIHARASRIANEKHKANIQVGDKIKYIYVKNGDVIAFKRFIYDGYLIDYEKMVRRIIDLKVGPIFDSLNWHYDYDIIKGNKREKEVPLERKYKQLGLW